MMEQPMPGQVPIAPQTLEAPAEPDIADGDLGQQ